MRRRRLLVTRGARVNLNNAILHSERAWGAEQAASYRRAIEDAFEQLLDHPELGVAREDIAAGARVLIVKHDRVIYRFTEDHTSSFCASSTSAWIFVHGCHFTRPRRARR